MVKSVRPTPASSVASEIDLSRRGFLKTISLGTAVTLGSMITDPVPVQASSEQKYSTQEQATLIDVSACVGCGACVEACQESNAHKFPRVARPFPKMVPDRVPVEDWSDRTDVDTRLTPYNWLFIQTAEVEWKGETITLNIPRRCMHCQNPPCANLCPWGAASKQENGAVQINDKICLGGAKCRTVCPWSIPQRQTGVGLYTKLLPRFAGNGVMYKCDRCKQRTAQGELPACIEACPQDVQTIGPRGEIVARARELAASMDGYIYGLEENGGTNTIYVSPVPFEQLNTAIAKGKGQPHLAAVEDVMKDEAMLAKGVFLAPVAGVAAGVLTMAAGLLKGKDADDKGKETDDA